MKKSEYLISELLGVPVYEPGKKGKPSKRVGKVRHFVFHPKARRVVGFTVKRPDIALMAHRSDLFVALDGFEIEEGHILIDPKSSSVGKAACKHLGVSWDECIMWQGLPLMTEAGDRCGFVGDVRFASADGAVKVVSVDRGKTADILLGYTDIPASLVKGFKLGLAIGSTMKTAKISFVAPSSFRPRYLIWRLKAAWRKRPVRQVLWLTIRPRVRRPTFLPK